jgi:hypothetical protein
VVTFPVANIVTDHSGISYGVIQKLKNDQETPLILFVVAVFMKDEFKELKEEESDQ